MPPDPNIETLNQLAREYHAAQSATKHIRVKLYAYIQELKSRGYTYPVLAAQSGFSPKGIQNIVDKGRLEQEASK